MHGTSGRQMRSVRTQGGFVAARLLLAFVASTGVTAGVAGPMAYQSHQAAVRAEQRQQQRPEPTPTTEPVPDPSVLGETTIPLPGESTPPSVPSVPTTTVVPRSSKQPGGGVTAPRPTTAPPATQPPETVPTPTDAPQIEPVPRSGPPTTDDGQGG